VKNLKIVLYNMLLTTTKIEKKSPILRYLTGVRLWVLLWLVVFGLTFAWRAQNLAAFGLSNDEGAHLMWARLAVEGYPLYSQTRAVQSPLFLEAVGVAFRLAGVSVETGRWAILISYIPLAMALSWLAYRSRGWISALMAVFLLGIAPLIFTFSRLVMAELPATGLAVISLALLFLFLAQKGRHRLVLSGFCFGLSLGTKALNPFVVAPVGFLLLLSHLKARRNIAGTNDDMSAILRGVRQFLRHSNDDENGEAARWASACAPSLCDPAASPKLGEGVGG
jgi:predicted membrane-bound mannosyltransferase